MYILNPVQLEKKFCCNILVKQILEANRENNIYTLKNISPHRLSCQIDKKKTIKPTYCSINSMYMKVKNLPFEKVGKKPKHKITF